MSSDRQAAGPLNGKFMRTIRNSYVNRKPKTGEGKADTRQSRQRQRQGRAGQGGALQTDFLAGF